MRKYGWKPTDFSDKNNITVNEGILDGLEYPEAKLLNQYLLLEKRLSMLVDGNAAWLKLVTKENRIHGRVKTAGAITGRCTHSSPNLAQVPASHSPYGEQCRELFTVPMHYRQVGCDASGLELRCLAHYLARYDGGEYAQIVLHGDIHKENQMAAGLATRDMAKTFIYGWLYGAGAAKLGQIVGGGAEEGAKLQAKFMKKFPAIKKLKDAVSQAVKERKSIRGLDGRIMNVRSEHSALNMLLQSAGALIMKRALIEAMREIDKRELDACPVLNIHDEFQFEVRYDQAEEVAKILEESMIKAGNYFKFRIPIEGQAKIGSNWKETH
jgi:DNA polymerase I-like protein with 3'-5' exonuclease and polymerase domains